MALHTLAKVVLTQDYGVTALDSSFLSDLNHATIDSPYSFLTQGSNLLLYFSAAFSKVNLPINSDVTVLNGSNFRLRLTLTSSNYDPGDNLTLMVSPMQGSSALSISSNGASFDTDVANVVVDFDFNSTGYSFDGVALVSYSTNTAITVFIKDVSIIALDDSEFTLFNTGDRISTYYNDVSGLIEVYREDNPGAVETLITDGPALGYYAMNRGTTIGVIFPREPTDPAPNGIGSSYTEYNFCSGTTWVRFGVQDSNPTFPYAYRYEYTNHAVCTINPPEDPVIVCDLQIVSVVVVHPTNDYSFDGSVQLSSVNGNGFATTYGQAGGVPINTTGLFTGLGPGETHFIALDDHGCVSQVFVNLVSKNVINPEDPVDEQTSYGAKYNHQYYDVHTEQQSVVQIFERYFTGDTVDVVGTEEPFILTKNPGDLNNKFEIIRGSSSVMNLISRKHFEYIGLFSQDDRKYKKAWNHLTGSWTGWVLSSGYNESYAPNKNYAVAVTSTDWLAQLSAYDFVDESGNNIYADLSLMDIISIILQKTDLKLDIVSAVNKFSTGMLTEPHRDPLNQAYIKTETFYDDGEPQKCDEVVNTILGPFGAFIIQRNSQWWIVETDSQCTSYTYRVFDCTGAYLSNSSYNPIVEIVSPGDWIGEPEEREGLLFAESDHSLDIVPAYGKISVKLNLKAVESIFPINLSEWQVNQSGTGGLITQYDIEKSRNKGLRIKSLTNGTCYFASPLFGIKTINDSIKIEFDYKTVLSSISGFPAYDSYYKHKLLNPPWTRIKWKLTMVVSSTSFCYTNAAGWFKNDYLSLSTTSISIPTTHTDTRTITIDSGLTIPDDTYFIIYRGVGGGAYDSTKFFTASGADYNPSTGSILLTSIANLGSGTYASWVVYLAGAVNKENEIIQTDFVDKVETFSKTIDLPSFTSVVDIQLQLQLGFEGVTYPEFVNTIGTSPIKDFITSILPLGTKKKGIIDSFPEQMLYFDLISGTNEDGNVDGIYYYRGNDYNADTNAVVWQQSGLYGVTKSIENIDVQNVRILFLPNKQNPSESEVLEFENNSNFKENLEYEINCGDTPTNILNSAKLYTNILKLSDGTPTYGWARKGFSEATTIQAILLKNLGNQYNKPTWRLSGTWLGPNVNFLNIVKHTTVAQEVILLNPSNPESSPWADTGSGIAWGLNTGDVSFSSVTPTSTNSKIRRQTVDGLVAGNRIRIDFIAERETQNYVVGDLDRADRLVCVLLDGNSIVQKVTLCDFTSDGERDLGVSFNIDVNATAIGFMVEQINVLATSIDALFTVSNFALKGVASVRYYYFNSLDRSDRNNIYKAEIVQLIPAVSSSDTSIDDTGGGNTGGVDNGGGTGGGAGGSSFSGGFDSGFSGDFDTILN